MLTVPPHLTLKWGITATRDSFKGALHHALVAFSTLAALSKLGTEIILQFIYLLTRDPPAIVEAMWTDPRRWYALAQGIPRRRHFSMYREIATRNDTGPILQH